MISSLSGRLEAIGVDGVVMVTGGVGFQVYTPTSTLSSLGGVGSEVTLHTHLYLREDSVSLYGFASSDELRLFQTLLGVSGLGPRLALAMLSAMNLEQLTTAISTGDTGLLTSISGVGKKVAERIVLELKDKVAAQWVTAAAVQSVEENSDVLDALVSLGYSNSEASRAVASIRSSKDKSLEARVKEALGYFTGR